MHLLSVGYMNVSGGNGIDLWSEIIAEEQEYIDQLQEQKIEVIYRRRRPQKTPPDVNS